ncbi:putative pre-neck/exonuclease [Clostridium phage CPD1]|nr:putative pre-neck/exonuclease [Clostridium phage CPD1]
MAFKKIPLTIDTMIRNPVPIEGINQEDNVELNIVVTENKTPKDLSRQTIKVYVRRIDGTLVEQTDQITPTNASKGEVTVKLKNSAFNKEGYALFQLDVSDSSGRITSSYATFKIGKGLASGEAIANTNEVEALKKIEEYIKKANLEFPKYENKINEFNQKTEEYKNEVVEYQGEVKKFQNIANSLQTQFDEAVANITNGVESATNSEIVQARGGEVNLNRRLDKFDSQLDKIVQGINGENTVIEENFLNIRKLNLYGTYVLNKQITLSNIVLVGNATIYQNGNIIDINDNVTLHGLKFELNNVDIKTSLNINGKNISIANCEIRNLYSSTYGRMIFISKDSENINIKQNVFNGLNVNINNIVGDTNGSIRAIQCQEAYNVIIENNIFKNINTREDSDYIHCQSTTSEDIDGVSFFKKGKILIKDNLFINPLKSVIKIQCSGVEVINNKIESDNVNYVDVFFRFYNSYDLKISNNYNSDTIECTFIYQEENTKNTIINNNKFNIRKPTSYSGSIFYLMSTNSKSMIIENDAVLTNGNSLLQLKKSNNVVIKNNLYDYTEIQIQGNYNTSILNNTTTNEINSFVDLSALDGISNSKITIEDNNVFKTERLANIRGNGHVGIYIINNSIKNEGNSFNAIAIFDETQILNNIFIENNQCSTLRYGATNKRPTSFNKRIGYNYFDVTLNKNIVWNGSSWVDYNGTSV